MIIDRTIQPPITTIQKIPLPKPEKITLSNGIPVYITNMGTQEVMKMQIIFRAGRPYEKKKLAARATSRMLREGTKNFTSKQIAETIDFYGATISMPSSLDYSSVVYYSMTKHFPQLIGLVSELLSVPTFPEKELQTYIANTKQRLQIDLTKNDVVAYRKVTELMFGKNHPYGYNSTEAMYEELNRGDLVQHFKENYHAKNCTIFLSGKIDKTILSLLDQYLGQLPIGVVPEAVFPALPSGKPKRSKFLVPNSLQKAVRIGRRTMTRQHEDYGGFLVLNTILGGYFGSRLMLNIREDKGYTYNIYSVQDTMHKAACFYVTTEVGNEFLKPALKEIYKEMALLQKELVPKAELDMVKNYILGNMLNMVDGPFRIIDVVKTLVLENSTAADFQKLVDLIQHITAEEIRTLAQKYFDKKEMWEVVA